MQSSAPQETAATEKRQDIHFAEKDEALRNDVRMLGNIVGELLVEQGGEALFKTVESARKLAIGRRENDTDASQKLDALLGKLSAAASRDIMRAFSTYFQVVNTAEQVHRIRRRRDYLKDTDKRQPHSLEETFYRLKEAGFGPDAANELLQKLAIEPVFTAHPTETTRRTILRKQQNIVRRMVDMQNPALTPQEINSCFESIRADITAIWQTEESPSEGLTVFDEREHTLFFLTDVIYRVIPPFYEGIEAARKAIYGETKHWPPLPSLLQFASWIGGDLSTNKNMSARIVRDTLARQRSLILDLYYHDCISLAEKLSQTSSRIDIDDGVYERISAYAKQFTNVHGTTSHRYRNMPYRVLLRLICRRLQATYDDDAFPYETCDQFIEDLRLIADSLANRKGAHGGLFTVNRLIRRAETFGFHFLSLDIRHNAANLHEVVGYCLGDPQWQTQSSAYRIGRLTEILATNASPVNEPDNDAKRLLALFSAISYCRRKYGRKAIGLVLVRQCQGLDDVLATLVLARWAGLHGTDGHIPLDIAPTCESSLELEHAADLLVAMLDNPYYMGHLEARGLHQTVMLRASEAISDGAVAAFRWKLQKAHTRLGKIFSARNIDYTLFHGRGSLSGRVGFSDGIARGHLRVTEHGEAVNERYGVRGIAFRTLEKAFSAVATATAGLDSKFAEKPEWAEAMNAISVPGDAAYRTLIGIDSNFDNYFRSATPIDVIEHMRTGLRADNDYDGTQIERDIPWAFAWAQSRHLLTAWYGIGTGLECAISQYGEQFLRDMLRDWPFFRRLANDIEIALAIADPDIASYYSELAGPELHAKFFPVISAEFNRSVSTLLVLQEQKVLLENNTTLRRSIRLRNPYVDPMSLLQVELLRRWRKNDRQDPALLTALIASVNGISRGLQTSG